MLKYQLMPPLSDADFAALKADIEKRGVLVPIEYDDDGEILDGHHRVRACSELGISDWPRLVRTGLSEEGKRQHARQLNLARRHLNNAQKRSLISDQLRDTPGKSNRQIAASLGVDDKTVGAVRKAAVQSAEIPHVSLSQDKSGRYQPANRPAKQKTSGPKRVLDPEFKAEKQALDSTDLEDFRHLAAEVASDQEIQRDETIVQAGAEAIYEENKRLFDINDALNRRIGTLNTENSDLKKQVKAWKKRALDSGWKPDPQ